MSSASPNSRSATAEIVIDYRDVSVRYGQTVALDGVTIPVHRGRTTALIGPSGCGKTTLLRLAIGLQVADGGSLSVLGHSLPASDLRSLRHSIGYVVQAGGLFPHLTCAQNVSIVARYLKWDLDRIRSRITELCALVQLPPELLVRLPRQLSGGQCQRVGLMRALFLDPQLLLLDEPLSALDPIVRAELQNDLKLIFERLNKSVLLVTHDLAEAGYLADELLLMQAGKLVQRGALRDLIERPANRFVTDFVHAQRGIADVLAGAGT